MSDEKALHRAMMDEATGIDATYTPRRPVYRWAIDFANRTVRPVE